jgi:hypothetical protein
MPSPEEMAASGFCADDFEADPVELWPENARAWQVFADMSGQWRQAFNGPTALDYTPLFARMDRLQLDPDAWEELFADVRVMEAQALRTMREPA